MFKSSWGSRERQAQPRPQETSTDSCNPPRLDSSPATSHPGTPSANSSSCFSVQKPDDRPQSLSHVSPAEATEIISMLKDKNVDELWKLLSDKDAYRNPFLSLEAVKTENSVRDELHNVTLQLTREILEKEPQILELQNQVWCKIIRTTELAVAQEKLHEVERRKRDMLTYYSELMNKTEEESESLHKQLRDREIDLRGCLALLI